MENASNQGAQNFFNNLGNAITSDLGAPSALASGISGLLGNGVSGLILPIGNLACLYTISSGWAAHKNSALITSHQF